MSLLSFNSKVYRGLKQRSVFLKWVNILLILLLVYCLTEVSLQCVKNSDAAIASAMGKAMAEGNIFLKGWFLSTTSFYFTDLVPHAIVYFFIKNMFLTSINAGILIAIICFVGGWWVYKTISGNKKIFSLYIGLFITFLTGCMSCMVFSPIHIGTIAYCLIAAYCYYNSFRYSFFC